MIQKIYIVKCFYLCASAAVFDNKVIEAKNQLRKIQLSNYQTLLSKIEQIRKKN